MIIRDHPWLKMFVNYLKGHRPVIPQRQRKVAQHLARFNGSGISD